MCKQPCQSCMALMFTEYVVLQSYGFIFAELVVLQYVWLQIMLNL